eukprot:CAMPEP_0195307442 /NCGR_PEP_ID=MMETSP0707-20130614/37716_1 /TAXON_ID=33640 /ORGANISM="Asterionellopsis glacialis, Strain CCMP134" /LENGTH=441 /DNA_ID=CAMNT_0040371693 /DNA_START=1760 /DNA_END=3085 /DNA_ORIENTATION=-
MKFSMSTILCLALSTGVQGFAPTQRAAFGAAHTTARSMAVDPSIFNDIPQHVESLRDAFTTMSLADLDTDAASQALDAAAAAVTSTPPEVADAAEMAATDNGWFGFLVGPIEGLLGLIHSALVGVGMSADAWGVSIIAMTLLIKLLTFPLTKTQLESTNKMQALQPTIKDIQAKYQSNPEVMNQKIAEIYQANEVNPLAGCLPSFAQIPIFIGLYRSVLNLAKEDKLNEPFLFLPNLEGPTYGADPAHGSDWILQGWTNGAPSLGWDDTIAFLILPVFLVISQFVSMELMQPKSDDPAQQQSNAILKVLPLMIGWFSLNVPAALCIYWVANNIVTTASTLIVRNSMKVEPIVPGAGGGATVAPPAPSQTVFTPPPVREKPSGFGAEDFGDGIKPITPIDAEIVDVDASAEAAPDAGAGMPSEQQPTKKRGGSKKKKKRRKN